MCHYWGDSNSMNDGEAAQGCNVNRDPMHNPWSDEDDPAFGREKDVQMSFE